MAIAAKEKEMNGCGKFSWRRNRAVPSAAATKIIAAPYRSPTPNCDRAANLEIRKGAIRQVITRFGQNFWSARPSNVWKHFLNPRFGAPRQIYGHGVGAIHQPDTSNELEEPYQEASGVHDSRRAGISIA